MIRAAAYIRVSTDKQAQEGDSIPAQCAALRKYIDDHENMVLAGEYIDDGESGTKDTRSALQELLRDVRERKVDVILVTKLDRLYRSIRHYLNMMDTLDKYNVGWLAVWEPIYDTTTPQGRLIVNQMMSIAQFEAENTSQRIKQVFDFKIKQGEVVTGNTPLGFSIINKHLVPNEDAPMVRDWFEWYDANNSIHGLHRYATAKYGRVHDVSYYKCVLKNSKYAGVWRGNENYCEPIVSRELFDRIQRKLASNIRRNKRFEYLFVGMIRCASCGRVYAGITDRHWHLDGSQYIAIRYRCSRHANFKDCTNSVTIKETDIENYLLENVRSLLKNRKLEYEYKQKQAAKAVNVIEKHERKLARLKELFVNGLISLDEYKKDAEQLRKALEAVQIRAEELRPMPINLPKDFDKLYDTMTVLEKRRLWQGVIKTILISKDKEIEVIFL